MKETPVSRLINGCVVAIVVASATTALASDWPQWRGPERTGRSAENNLLTEWPEGGPKLAWSREDVGAAYSSVSVADGRVFTQGNKADDNGNGADQEHVICLDENTGDVLWSVALPAGKKQYAQGKRGAGPRGTPTVDGDFIYTVGAGGEVACLEAKTGRIVWHKHFIDDFGAKGVPTWDFSESPLIDGEKCIVTPGGPDGTIAALNKTTGETIWRSTDVTDAAHYCSAIVAEVHGVRQYIQFTKDRLIGVDAETGAFLWDYKGSANRTANISTAICIDDMVFSASAYGTGGGLVKLIKDGNKWSAEEQWFEKKIQNHHGGVIYVDGYIYGTGSNTLMCLDFETGEIQWQSRGAGKGSITYADGHLYHLGENNTMCLVKANPEEYVETGRFKTPSTSHPDWAHPVVANGKLYLRDQNLLNVYNVAK